MDVHTGFIFFSYTYTFHLQLDTSSSMKVDITENFHRLSWSLKLRRTSNMATTRTVAAYWTDSEREQVLGGFIH